MLGWCRVAHQTWEQWASPSALHQEEPNHQQAFSRGSLVFSSVWAWTGRYKTLDYYFFPYIAASFCCCCFLLFIFFLLHCFSWSHHVTFLLVQECRKPRTHLDFCSQIHWINNRGKGLFSSFWRRGSLLWSLISERFSKKVRSCPRKWPHVGDHSLLRWVVILEADRMRSASRQASCTDN